MNWMWAIDEYNKHICSSVCDLTAKKVKEEKKKNWNRDRGKENV